MHNLIMELDRTEIQYKKYFNSNIQGTWHFQDVLCELNNVSGTILYIMIGKNMPIKDLMLTMNTGMARNSI